MNRCLFSPAACNDIDEIFDYLSQHSLSAAENFLEQLQVKTDFLARNPRVGTPQEHLLSGLKAFPLGNYVLFFRPLADGVEIVRVIHGARDFLALFSKDAT